MIGGATELSFSPGQLAITLLTSPMVRADNWAMLKPPKRTASASGRNRAPWHSGQGFWCLHWFRNAWTEAR